MNNQMLPIGKLFDIEKGALQSTKCTPGDYDFITAAEEWKTHIEYTHECEALIFAAAASGSLGRTHYVDGKFSTSDLCYILTPKNDEKYPINLSFYNFVFNSLRPSLVAATKSGTSKESINQTNFRNYEIPYFDIELQDFWIEKLKNTLGLKELLRRELNHQQSLLKKLRQQILQEAIEGKLTANWRAQNPDVEAASELLKRIAAEKAQLVKGKKLKAQKPLPAITDEEKPFELPRGWEWCRFGDVLESTFYGPRFGKSEYVKNGIPTIRTTDMDNGVINFDNPPSVDVTEQKKIDLYKLLFNDLLVTRTGSIGTMALYQSDALAFPSAYLIRCRFVFSDMAEFLYKYLHSPMVLQHFGLNTKTGSRPNINAVSISNSLLPLPSLEEQQAIVTKVEKLFALCDQLETQITYNQSHAEQLMQAVLKEAFSHNSEAAPSAKKGKTSADTPEVARA